MSGSKLKTPSMGFAVSIVNPVKHLKATHESIIFQPNRQVQCQT